MDRREGRGPMDQEKVIFGMCTCDHTKLMYIYMYLYMYMYIVCILLP